MRKFFLWYSHVRARQITISRTLPTWLSLPVQVGAWQLPPSSGPFTSFHSHSFPPSSSFLQPPQPLSFECQPLHLYLHLHGTSLPPSLLLLSFSNKPHVFGSIKSVAAIPLICVGPLLLLPLFPTTSLPLPLHLMLPLRLMGRRSIICQTIWLPCWLIFPPSLLLLLFVEDSVVHNHFPYVFLVIFLQSLIYLTCHTVSSIH